MQTFIFLNKNVNTNNKLIHTSRRSVSVRERSKPSAGIGTVSVWVRVGAGAVSVGVRVGAVTSAESVCARTVAGGSMNEILCAMNDIVVNI